MSTVTTESSHAEGVESAPVRQWPYRMSYEIYEQIAELRMIRPEEHVVLLDGILVQTMTEGPDHSFSMLSGQEIVRFACPQGWHVRPEQPIAIRDGLGGASAPEPDLSVVAGSLSRYSNRHPEAFEVGLIVEIAKTSAAFADDRAGLRRYAHVGIPTVLIVALHDRTVHVHTEPTGSTDEPMYARIEVKRSGDLLEVVLKSVQSNEPPAILGPIAVASFFSTTL